MGLNIDQMTQIDNIQLVDANGNLAVIKPASTAALATDTSLVTAFSPNSSLPTGSNTIGAVTQASGPWTSNITQFGSSAVVTGTGASGAGIPRMTISNDSNILATQSGTWNITNISGTISLPTGASTSALQTTGNTSLSSIVTNTNSLILAQGSTTSGQTGNLIMGAVTTNPPTYVTAQTNPFSLTIDGDLRVADIVNTSGQYRAQSVTTSAAEALGGATILANRKMLSVTPTNGTIYWGFSNAVTTSSGSPIFKNQTVTFAVGANVHVYVIAGSTTDCRMAEGS